MIHVSNQVQNTTLTPSGAKGTVWSAGVGHTYDSHPPRCALAGTAHMHGACASRPQSAMSTAKELASDGWVVVAYVLPILLLRKSLIKSTSTRMSLGVALSWARRQKTRERMHRITCCMQLSRLMNWHICHSLMLDTTDSLIHMLSFSMGSAPVPPA